MMSYAYDTIADIIRLGEENNISFGDVVLRYELENYDRSEDAVVREIENRLDIFGHTRSRFLRISYAILNGAFKNI